MQPPLCSISSKCTDAPHASALCNDTFMKGFAPSPSSSTAPRLCSGKLLDQHFSHRMRTSTNPSCLTANFPPEEVLWGVHTNSQDFVWRLAAIGIKFTIRAVLGKPVGQCLVVSPT